MKRVAKHHWDPRVIPRVIDQRQAWWQFERNVQKTKGFEKTKIAFEEVVPSLMRTLMAQSIPKHFPTRFSASTMMNQSFKHLLRCREVSGQTW